MPLFLQIMHIIGRYGYNYKGKRGTQRMKKIGNWLSNILLIVVILISISYIFNLYQIRQKPDQIPSTFGFIPLTVLSGSMSPTIETGDMIVVRNKAAHLQVGEIGTYRVGNSLVTHRVMEITTDNGNVAYITQGDANNTTDGNPINKDQLVGKYQLRIPFAGYVIANLRGWLGIVLAIGILTIMAMTKILKVSKTQLSKADGSNQ
ncbi:MAG: signal peptidase [Clostridia bacterium]|nr:signal peptidase [Clostridia bacterium]